MARIEDSESDDDLYVAEAKRPRTSSYMATTLDSTPTRVAPTCDRATLKVYQQMLPLDGIRYLFSKEFSGAFRLSIPKIFGTYEVLPEVAIEEFRRLIAIKVFTADVDAEKISPTPLMDEIWHAAILDTKLYANLQTALGVVLHHRPSGADDDQSEQRQQRVATMTTLYKRFFSTDLLGTLQPGALHRDRRIKAGKPMQVLVCLDGRKHVALRIGSKDTVNDIMLDIEDKEGIALDHRLIYDGNSCNEGWTMDYCGIEEGDTLELWKRVKGC